MNSKRFRPFLILLLAVLWTTARGTHNRAGEIVYRHLGGFAYEVTIITYTKISAPADRDSLLFDWGDGSPLESFLRVVKDDATFGSRDIRVNKYVGTHTYPGAGEYVLSFQDPNRNNGILNLEPPPEQGGQSDQVVFYVESKLVINAFAPSGVSPHNNSVQLLNPPVDRGCIHQPFRHNPAAFDPDGDSLVYRLVPNRVEGGIVPAYYKFPNEINPGPDNNIQINSRTGDLIWDAPKRTGQYNIAILIEEYRNGIRIGSVLRDMQIDVLDCGNVAPDVLTLQDTCIEAGTLLSFEVLADDDNDSQVTMTAVGQPFEVEEPARFEQTRTAVVARGDFSWQTGCGHVIKPDYNVVFKGEDNNSVPLADFESVNIRVVGPAVDNVVLDELPQGIAVSWDPNFCSNVTGYKVYRKADFFGFVPDPCQTGVPAFTGYEQVAKLDGLNTVNYLDEDVRAGIEYCYMIVACFPDGAEGYASTEICTEIAEDVPVLTHVSVGSTDPANGRDTIRWNHPLNLDTVNTYSPPYRYDLYRVNPDGSRAVVFSTGNQPFLLSLDTEFVDLGLNTALEQQVYELELWSDNNLVAATPKASSLFLAVTPADRMNILNFVFDTPWKNKSFRVFRFNDITGEFALLGTTTQTTYTDSNLVNGTEYCYYVISSGQYLTGGFPKPLLNHSQEACATPQDFTPPCPPVMAAEALCEEEQTLITWRDTNAFCVEDLVRYDLYYSPTPGGNYQLLEQFGANDSDYVFSAENSIAGCFYIRVTDDNGNTSDSTNVVCTDNCPDYRLPNVFTPNNDGQNDRFRPFPYSFVRDVDVTIFNRWGRVVFETDDPDINWDGTYKNQGQILSEGVYFYVIQVNKITLDGVVSEELSGHVTLLRE